MLAFLGKKQRLEYLLIDNEIQPHPPHTWHPLSATNKIGNVEMVEYILQNFLDTWQGERQKHLDEGLDKGIEQSHADVIKILFLSSANPNSKPSTTHAAFRKRDDIVSILYAFGGYISPWDMCGSLDYKAISSLLHYAPELARSEKPILIGRSPGDNLFTSGPSSIEMI